MKVDIFPKILYKRPCGSDSLLPRTLEPLSQVQDCLYPTSTRKADSGPLVDHLQFFLDLLLLIIVVLTVIPVFNSTEFILNGFENMLSPLLTTRLALCSFADHFVAFQGLLCCVILVAYFASTPLNLSLARRQESVVRHTVAVEGFQALRCQTLFKNLSGGEGGKLYLVLSDLWSQSESCQTRECSGDGYKSRDPSMREEG